MEAGVVIDINGKPLYWHLPNERTVVSLPDSATLWDIFWTNQDKIAGFAHSHPGSGVPGPSHEDVTTFAPVEAALGKRYDWWITSTDRLIVARWKGPHRLTYESTVLEDKPPWLEELREFSIATNNNKNEVQNDRQYYSGQ